MVFNRYKNDECLDHTDCQGDFSVMGNEFINFLSTVATCRIIRKAGKAGLLDNMSYAELMDDLSSAWRRMDSPTEPATDDGISSRPYLLSWRLLDYPNRCNYFNRLSRSRLAYRTRRTSIVSPMTM